MGLEFMKRYENESDRAIAREDYREKLEEAYRHASKLPEGSAIRKGVKAMAKATFSSQGEWNDFVDHVLTKEANDQIKAITGKLDVYLEDQNYHDKFRVFDEEYINFLDERIPELEWALERVMNTKDAILGYAGDIDFTMREAYDEVENKLTIENPVKNDAPLGVLKPPSEYPNFDRTKLEEKLIKDENVKTQVEEALDIKITNGQLIAGKDLPTCPNCIFHECVESDCRNNFNHNVPICKKFYQDNFHGKRDHLYRIAAGKIECPFRHWKLNGEDARTMLTHGVQKKLFGKVIGLNRSDRAIKHKADIVSKQEMYNPMNEPVIIKTKVPHFGYMKDGEFKFVSNITPIGDKVVTTRHCYTKPMALGFEDFAIRWKKQVKPLTLVSIDEDFVIFNQPFQDMPKYYIAEMENGIGSVIYYDPADGKTKISLGVIRDDSEHIFGDFSTCEGSCGTPVVAKNKYVLGIHCLSNDTDRVITSGAIPARNLLKSECFSKFKITSLNQ
jgi:hypothetical protein